MTDNEIIKTLKCCTMDRRIVGVDLIETILKEMMEE